MLATTRASSLPLAPPAGLLPELRARAGAGSGRGRVRRAGRPGRRWYPDKLADAARAHRRRPARLQRRPGHRRAAASRSPRPTGHARRNNHADLLSLLVANAVTGAASLFRRSLLDHALPFPPAQFAHFHDHWIALVGPRARRDRVRRPPALRLRPARRRPRSGTPPPTRCRGCASGSAASAPRSPRARARCGGCTTSSTCAG